MSIRPFDVVFGRDLRFIEQLPPRGILPGFSIPVRLSSVRIAANALAFSGRSTASQTTSFVYSMSVTEHRSRTQFGLEPTYSHQRRDGTLFTYLEESLARLGVSFAPVCPAAVVAMASQDDYLKPVVNLLCSFLSLFKGNGWTLREIAERARGSEQIERASRFVELFGSLLDRYTETLRASNEIDFNDMIAQATERVTSGKYRSLFKYILVDEFQDMARGRARLVKALRDRVPDSRLFCVGDDWQSIYRFTGSDIAMMIKFDEHFGFQHAIHVINREDAHQPHIRRLVRLDANHGRGSIRRPPRTF